MRLITAIMAVVVLITAVCLSGGCGHSIIPDKALERNIRVYIGKSEGELTNSDLEKVTIIWATGDEIKNLTGLELCVNLSNLNLSNNNIKDFGPLANLTKLRKLDLENNKITDISVLAGLTNLTTLNLNSNRISDIAILKNMTKLEHLSIVNNEIEDITALASMKHLTTLTAERNQIRDISPLLSLDNIEKALLDWNPLNEKSFNEYIPMIQQQGTYIRCWPTEEEEEILRLIFTGQRQENIESARSGFGEDSEEFKEYMKQIEDFYEIIEPEMKLDDYITITEERIISSFEDLGYDLTGLASRLIELNREPLRMNIELSKKDGYVIDYDGRYMAYFKEKYDIGWKNWEKLREENPGAGGIIWISIPAYDPETGLVVCTIGWQGYYLFGIGYLVLFKYENGNLEFIDQEQIWVS